ncbi:NAD(P)-dependent oxidoreductase [Pseudomonas abietaniphila]|uniref:NAD(P)-dependent oxidoreductase n=1 Tax=Pseudomonas abietaniphila TaxID=89065 RepID=UPI0032164A76
MTAIAVLGLGAMGSRMAANLLKAGHAVTVWNRSPDAADALVATGATLAATPREAAQGASIVLSMVRDDIASNGVWLDPEHGAFGGMLSDSLAIECSTLSPRWIKALGEAANEAGIRLIDAPVSGSRPQAEAAQLVFLVGGDEADVAFARGVLSNMGSSIQHVGPLGAGTLVKLTTNAMLGVQVTALAELFGILAKSGVSLKVAFDAVGATAVSSVAAQRSVDLMVAGTFEPQFPVALIEKDLRYLVNVAGSPAAAPTIDAARKVFGTGIDQGFGEQNMTSVVQVFAADFPFGQ